MKKWLRWLRELLRFKGDFGDFYICPDGAQVSLPTGMRDSDRLLRYLDRTGLDTETIEHAPVCTENSNTGMVVMTSAQDGA
jgi:hypothetical protein